MDEIWTAVPIATGCAALGFGALRRERMFRKEKVAALKQQADVARALLGGIPAGAVYVQDRPIPRRDGLVLPGSHMLVANGTPGCNRVLDSLRALDRAGLLDIVGSVLVNEGDTVTRRSFETAVPKQVHDRIVYGHSNEFPSGFGNLPPTEVESLVGRWGVPLLEAIERVVTLHIERNGARPGEIVLDTSLGGHGFPGVFITQELKRRVPDAQILGIVNLPRKEVQREYFLGLKERYEAAGVAAWLISDQMEPDWVTQDSVIGDIFASITAASIGSDSSPRVNNIVTSVAGSGTGGMARYEYLYSDIPAHRFQPDSDQPPRFFVYKQQAIGELQTLIENMEHGRTRVSIAAPIGEPKRHTYDLALCAVEPADVLAMRDHIEKARDIEDEKLAAHTRPHLHPHLNYETIYTSWSCPIDPEHPRCRLAVIRLRALHTSRVPLPELLKAPEARNFAPVPAQARQTVLATTNGEADLY